MNDLSNRLSIVLKEAKYVAARDRVNGLGAWATLVSCICEKMYSSRHGLLEADVGSALSFLDLPAFAQELDRVLLGKQRNATGSTNEELALEAVQEWHFAVLRGLESSPGAVLDQAAIPALLRVHEQQWDFERVSELLGGLKEVEIPYRYPQVLLACLEVCIAHQDLDGIATLLESGIPLGAKTMDDAAHSFVSEAMGLFWRAEEFDLAAICLTAISERARQLGCEDTLNAFDAALNAAADRVRQQFPGTPRLLLQRAGKDAAI